jgi:long-chain acyl-CoA synthetase
MAGQFFLACCLYNGIAQVLIPNPRDSGHVCRQIRRYRPTVLAGPPSLLSGLSDYPVFGALDFSALDYCICGAEPFPEEARQALERIIGPGKIMEVYGLTETCALTTANPRHGRRKPGSIGLPLPNTDIRLIDPATGKPATFGTPGEICVDGPQVMAGYHNRPKETRQSFDAAGYFHTGDMAVQDDHGYLHIMDRTRDMIRAGGFTVFSLKIEGVLCRHPAVHRVAAIGATDPENPEIERIKVFVTLKNGYRTGRDAEVLKEEILTFAADKLTPYELPDSLEIRAELPLTILGHVDKQALRREMRPQGWTGQERRAQSRGMVDLPCDIRGLSNGRATRTKGHVANVNREGMFIEAEKPLDQGTQIAAQITLIRFGNTFWVKGDVLRTTERGMAVRFREGIPPEIATILHPAEGK